MITFDGRYQCFATTPLLAMVLLWLLSEYEYVQVLTDWRPPLTCEERNNFNIQKIQC